MENVGVVYFIEIGIKSDADQRASTISNTSRIPLSLNCSPVFLYIHRLITMNSKPTVSFTSQVTLGFYAG